MELNTLSLNIAGRQPVTGSLGLMGKKEVTAVAAVAGATYAAPSTTPVSTASANVASLGLGGTFPPPKVRSLTLSVTNNMRTREVVGDLYSQQFGLGRFEVTGSIQTYFETVDAYQPPWITAAERSPSRSATRRDRNIRSASRNTSSAIPSVTPATTRPTSWSRCRSPVSTTRRRRALSW